MACGGIPAARTLFSGFFVLNPWVTDGSANYRYQLHPAID
jgi:hypothetical protein